MRNWILGLAAAGVIATTLPSTAQATADDAAARQETTAPEPAPSAMPGDDAAADSAPAKDLTALSLEDLMSIEVTSVSKSKQRVAEAPAAISVISQDDIRRSGMTAIPELLRLAPGLTVARINANQWAVGSRGFNDLYSNKLLVLMDGRTVYIPLFSGVYWDAVDYVLPDLDRIEVIRGPGATLWGANAVNGVINISSKSARDTQGGLASAHYSGVETIGQLRYGGQIGENTYYRVFTKYRDTDNFDLPNDGEAHDGWSALRGGFRIDHYFNDNADQLTLQGDVYDQRIGQTFNFPSFAPPFVAPTDDTFNTSGGNLLARWTHNISDQSDFSVQAYYDRFQRDTVQLGYALDTFDIDLNHRFGLGTRQEIIWGLNFRFQSDAIDNSEFVQFDPRRRDDSLVGAFVQDDITLIPDRLHLILGSKFEVNEYTGFEAQPSGRVVWTPNEKNSVWGAISRAVRTPARWEEDSRQTFAVVPTPAGVPGSIELLSDRDIESEDVIAYELGYRVQATSTFSVDLATFYNDYNNLRSGLPGNPFPTAGPPPHLVIPVALGQDIEGQTYGAEVAASWSVSPDWRLVGSYTWLNVDLHRGAGIDSTLETTFEGSSPRHQFQVRSYYDITRDLSLNAAAFYVDHLETGDVPSYVRLDASVTWRPKPNLELTVGVTNLLDDEHPEFSTSLFDEQPTETPRMVYGQVVWRF